MPGMAHIVRLGTDLGRWFDDLQANGYDLPALLFDLEKDPDELHNCLDDPAYAQIALACAQKMLSWRMSNDERVLTNILVKDGAHEHPDERRSYRSALFDVP